MAAGAGTTNTEHKFGRIVAFAVNAAEEIRRVWITLGTNRPFRGGKTYREWLFDKMGVEDDGSEEAVDALAEAIANDDRGYAVALESVTRPVTDDESGEVVEVEFWNLAEWLRPVSIAE
jgi:hypothetical protein